jgi:thiamine pyrophosphate-dependent acetolactate synthase large subunit-like protein
MTDEASATAGTVRDLLARCLDDLGATRVFGSAESGVSGLAGLAHVLVEDPALAVVLADASGRISRGPGVAALPGQVLRLGSQPGAHAGRAVIDDVADLPTALAAWNVGVPYNAVEYVLDLDLDAPAPPGSGPVSFAGEVQASTLARDIADVRSVIVVGPGVIRHDAVGALHEVASRLGAGVLNTWGAKGVYRWDSPYHFGTVGLQARDAELAGLTAAELVITSGLDPAELPVEGWATGPVLDVDPRALEALTYQWEPSTRELVRPRLYDALSKALAPMYASDAVPLSPARAAADLGATRPEGAIVVADPGRAGFWVARTLPTTEVGSVVVPALPTEGFALAAAIVAAFDERVAVAVTAEPFDATSAELLALAEHWGVDVTLEVWGADAALPSPDARVERLREALAAPAVSVLPLPVDLDALRALEDVAGPVVAWRR